MGELEFEKINTFSSINTYVAHRSHSVSEMLKKLNLETKHFAILCNGQRVDIEHMIEPEDEIIILPKIAGGI
ncbi:MAG: MoaD/ThiS family protein [Promethearchaeota archaeon]